MIKIADFSGALLPSRWGPRPKAALSTESDPSEDASRVALVLAKGDLSCAEAH